MVPPLSEVQSSNTYIHILMNVLSSSKLSNCRDSIDDSECFKVRKRVLTVTPTGKIVPPHPTSTYNTSTTSWGLFYRYRPCRYCLRLHITGSHRRLRLANRAQIGAPGFGTDF